MTQVTCRLTAKNQDQYGLPFLLPVNKPETTDMVIIARWPQVLHTAVSYSTYHTSLAVADDLLCCDWLG